MLNNMLCDHCLPILILLLLGHWTIAATSNDLTTISSNKTAINDGTTITAPNPTVINKETATTAPNPTAINNAPTTTAPNSTAVNNETATTAPNTTTTNSETSTIGYEVTTLSSNAKEQCAKDLLDWCSKNKYPTKNEISILSVDYFDIKLLSRVYCSVTYDGTDCARDMIPWFHCFPNGTFVYLDAILNNSSSYIDDGVCETKDTALKFTPDMGFNRNYFHTELKKFMKDMQDLLREFHIMQDIVGNVNKQLLRNNPNIFDINTEFEEFLPDATPKIEEEKKDPHF